LTPHLPLERGDVQRAAAVQRGLVDVHALVAQQHLQDGQVVLLRRLDPADTPYLIPIISPIKYKYVTNKK
jgi:hypothetical protein